jgi:hypothetical protein
VADEGVRFGADTVAAVSAAIVGDVCVHHSPDKYVQFSREYRTSPPYDAVLALLAECPRAFPSGMCRKY